MRRLRVQLLPTFHLFVPSVKKSSYRLPEIVETAKDTLTLVDRKFNQGQGHPLHDGLNIAVMEDIQLVHPKLIPSFRSYGLALEYEIQVDVWGECAGHEFSGIACREKVQVVSGWSATASPGSTLPAESDDRPEYHELDSVARHELGGQGPRRWLPGGDGAPEYDDDYTTSATALHGLDANRSPKRSCIVNPFELPTRLDYLDQLLASHSHHIRATPRQPLR
jgi:hypothetical protein